MMCNLRGISEYLCSWFSSRGGQLPDKSAKYADIETNYMFQPIAVESLGPVNASGCAFLSKLGRQLSTQSGDNRETSFLFQWLSVLIQRFNAILLLDSFVKEEEE